MTLENEMGSAMGECPRWRLVGGQARRADVTDET